ncbi:ferritin subunit, partial [Ceratina calcarata]|uniref:Ferritin n=1 Tax=Ceratina calcarata TaxID=156304 RepID=A0AAJ7NC49_9HYME
MKVLYVFLIAFVCINGSVGVYKLEKVQCTHAGGKVPPKWLDMVNDCTVILESQLKNETEAAMTYLAMGAHFARDTVNRPGFSNFFFDSASEERQHAIKIIEYLLMRGQLTSNRPLLDFPLKPLKEQWQNGLEALTEALDLEAQITQRLHSINRKCEKPGGGSKFNDYHLVDWLTGDFLDEQYKGERDL